MAEQRLIDANALYEDWLENGENEYVYDTNSFLSSLNDAPTIDPETLPIVRQMREELARVTAERDDYKELFFSYRNVCGGHDPQRISELVEADKEGRCVVLPFNIGDYVWVTMAYGKECNPPVKGVLQKFVLHDDEIVYLEAIILMDIGDGNIEYGYSEKSFGKCVHASLKAAEAALAKEAK